MLAIQYIVGMLNSPIEQFVSIIYSYQDMKISLERINEIHNRPDEDCDNGLKTAFCAEKNIIIKNMNFKYDLFSPKYILKNINVVIPAGKVTAIVGASGSGKTTLIKLLLGYYNSFEGEILIANESIRKYNLRWLRGRCGTVMQDGCIFSDSIARNIAVGDELIDFQKLEYAAKIANIYDFIIDLPLKYDTKIGQDGIGLSQGQKQRLLIARAVYKNPDFIFLDEATNALDAINEKIIVSDLENFYYGKTVIIVAHRLSTVKNADQIIVLENGGISEVGNHFTLIQKRGSYYNLVKNQLEIDI